MCKHSLIKRLAAAIKTGLRLLQAESTRGSTAADEQSKHSREDPSNPREAGLRVLLSLQETFTELLLAWANPRAEPGSTAANRSEMAKQLAKSGARSSVLCAAAVVGCCVQDRRQQPAVCSSSACCVQQQLRAVHSSSCMLCAARDLMVLQALSAKLSVLLTNANTVDAAVCMARISTPPHLQSPAD